MWFSPDGIGGDLSEAHRKKGCAELSQRAVRAHVPLSTARGFRAVFLIRNTSLCSFYILCRVSTGRGGMLENLAQIFSVPVRAKPAWKIKGDAAFLRCGSTKKPCLFLQALDMTGGELSAMLRG